MRLPFRFRSDQWNSIAIAAVVLLVASFVLGGASRQHALRLASVELAALPLLGLVAAQFGKSVTGRLDTFALGLVALLAALPLLQVIPLPPAVFIGLPGREQLPLALDLAGLQPGWLSLSLTPDATWQAFLALLPPLAMFGAIVVGGFPLGRQLSHLMIALTAFGMFLGAAQLASGGTQFYFWTTTAAGNVVGFFANRNHMASLVLLTLPFAAVLGSRGLSRPGSGYPGDRRTALWVSGLYLTLAIIALGVIRSRAGIVLAAPVLGASMLAAWIAAGRGRPSPMLLGLAAMSAAAVAAVAIFAIGPILARFDPETNSDSRFENWPVVAEVAQAYLPLGTGVGSFDAVYRSVEPLELLDPTFFNHAHNEYLEIWLEAGWPGIALLVAFLAWYGRRTLAVWRNAGGSAGDLQRAASIGILSLLLHSVFDYPLRTETLAVVMAMCCGLLALPLPVAGAQSVRKRVSRAHGL